MYPAIEPRRLTGDESLIAPNGEKVGSLIDFWRWAYSDLVSNAERGILAEYIVSCALGINQTVRIPWNKYDLLTQDNVSVEVKTSGYLQAWEQKNLSKIVFGIRPTYGWDSSTNEYAAEQKRQADVYVFCVHNHKEQETIDPLALSQWDFYVLATHTINEKFRGQKTVSLSALKEAGAKHCEYSNLKSKISQIV